MPVHFISKTQQSRYGRYNEDPSPEQLARYFYLDDRDWSIIRKLSSERNRLGFALQLVTVRFLGTFLSKPAEAPLAVVQHVAQQLGLKKIDELGRYALESSGRRHARQIQELYDYQDFTNPTEGFHLVRWLYARTWMTDETPSVLFDGATARLVERKVLLPGATTLARLVAQVEGRADRRLWDRLSKLLSQDEIEKLEGLLTVPSGSRKSTFDGLRRGPDRVSGPALVTALRRATEFEALNSRRPDVSAIPPNRLKSLALYAFAAHAPMLAQMSRPRRLATLLAFSLDGQVSALDDAIDILDALIADLKATAETEAEKSRLAASADLSEAALCLRQACQPLMDASVPDSAVRSDAFARVSRIQLQRAMDQTARLARSPAEAFHLQLMAQHARVRRFLPALLREVRFHATPGGQPVLDALAFLRSIEGQSSPEMAKAPRAVVSRSWHRWVFPDQSTVDRRAYTLCVLEQLQDRLHSRDIFLPHSERWGDPRLKLLQGDTWKALRPQVCRSLDRRESAQEEVAQLGEWLDQAYRRTLETQPNREDWRTERKNGRDRLVVSALDKLDERESLTELKDMVGDLLPHVDLPEALLEIQARTGFAGDFTHLSEPRASVKDLSTSVCAVLTVAACNIPLDPIVRPDIPALTRRRLRWIQQNYIRPETIARANARLVDAQAQLPLAKLWGGGEVASADGLRFRTPVRTVYSGSNPKYFGTGRGVTYINFVSDQFTGFHGIVVPGTLRDSLFILEGLLQQETSLEPKELMTDTAGVSEIIFGLFWLLGYQFSPRLADIGGARFWRIDSKADYGPLNGLSRNKINIRRIVDHWDDLLRVAGSLKMGVVRASELLRSLFRTDRRSSLTRALAELGRIPKTVHHLTYISDENYRRRTLTQLNHGESRHSVAREVFHGRRGELRQKYRQGQEEQLGALGLVVNALALWNTIYMQAALDHLDRQKVVVREEDAARLSPLGHNNFNFLGRYSFDLPPDVAKGELRHLRAMESVEE